MRPVHMLSVQISDDRVIPAFLGEHDHPWLRELLDERERFTGRRWWELEKRMHEPLSKGVSPAKRALAIGVLLSQRSDLPRPQGPLAPRRVRAEVFGLAAQGGNRQAILERAASGLGRTAADLESLLFGDLPGERLVPPLDRATSPLDLALRANLALARSLLSRARSVLIEIDGRALPVVRRARWRGLIVSVERRPASDACLEISGPLALFHHTLVYGRALGELVPLLAWSRRFRLKAACVLDGKPRFLELATGDPIFPSGEPKRYDSRVEERFARDLMRAAPDWDVIREPEAIQAGSALAFPDFALVHRELPSRRWFLEIVGFWTPEYLAHKLATYRVAGLENLILCIDEAHNCSDRDLPEDARIVRYRRKVDPKLVLAIIEGREACSKAEGPAPASDRGDTDEAKKDRVKEARPEAVPDHADRNEVLAAARAIARRSKFGNAFVPAIQKRIGRIVALKELIALSRAGWLAISRPTADFAVTPLEEPRPPIPVTLDSVREHIGAVVESLRSCGQKLLYQLVRERFDWVAEDGSDRLLSVVKTLAADGSVVLSTDGGSRIIDRKSCRLT